MSERRRQERALFESEEHFRSLVSHGSDVIAVVGADGSIRYASPSVERVLGYEPGEMEGTKIFSYLRPEEAREISETFAERLLVPGVHEDVEFSARHKSGSWVRLEVVSNNLVSDGSVGGLVMNARDVTEKRRAEEALKRSEERYRRLVESSPEAIAVHDGRRVLYANPAAARLFGADAPEELIGKEVVDFVHPDHRRVVASRMWAILEKGEEAPLLEMRHLRLDGSVVDVEVASQPVAYAGKSAVQAVVRDVTERKRAEKALKRSEEEQRRRTRELSLLHEVRSALSRELDPEGVCRAVVEAVADAYGYVLVSAYLVDGEQLTMQHQVGYRTELRRIPTDRGVMWRTVRSGEPVLLEDAHADPGFLDAIQGIVSEICVPLFDGGQVVGTLNVESAWETSLDEDDLRLLEEVGEHAGVALGRARLHERLRQAEERFRTAFDNASAGVALVGLDRRYLRANRALCEMFGYEEGELLEKRSSDITHPDDQQKSSERTERILRGEAEAISLEKRYLRRDGSVVWTISDVSLVRDSEGSPSHFVTHFQDITARKKTEEALQESEARLRALTEGAPVILFALDAEGVITLSEGKGMRSLGLEAGEGVGLSVFEAYRELPQVLACVRRALSGEEVAAQVEIGAQAYETRYSPVKNGMGAVAGVIGVATDVTERKALEEELERQALHDPLTGLANRRLLLGRLSRALERPASRVALLFLDLDDFKVVNDSLGHEVGDRLLAAAGERLEGSVRPSDLVSRLGGDEFVILLEDAGLDRAHLVARRIAVVLSAPFSVDGREVHASASVGIALGGIKGREAGREADPSELLREADVAMYRAKRSGKGSHAVFDPETDAGALERLGLENALRQGLEQDQFSLRYQPVVSVVGGEVVGLEALLRWEHPERGVLAPAEFLAAAGEAGLAADLDEVALQGACRLLAVLGRSGRTPPPWVSVNVSPRRLREPGFARVVAGALRAAGADPARLVVEVTEDAVVEVGKAEAALGELKNLGTKLALDDFGTGYSSLSYLERLPTDLLKLDRAFVENLGSSPKKYAVVRAVVDLAHATGMAVVAEGIETEGQLGALRRAGCDLAQGHLFSKPLEADEAVCLIEGRS